MFSRPPDTHIHVYFPLATACMVLNIALFQGAQTPVLSYASRVSKCMGALQNSHSTLNIVYINTINHWNRIQLVQSLKIKIEVLFLLHFYIHTLFSCGPAGGMRLNMIQLPSKPSNQLVQTFNQQLTIYFYVLETARHSHS